MRFFLVIEYVNIMLIFYFDIEGAEPSPPVPVFVSVGPSTLQTESSGVRDGSASVTSTS